MVTIRDELPSDVAQRERLLDACFGPERFEKTCERLREGRRPARGLALVAKDEGELVGTVRLWPVCLAGAGRVLLLGPLAVDREAQGRGIGAALVGAALARAAEGGHDAVLLVGDAPYYARFGFSAEHAKGLTLPGPFERDRLLGLELAPGALAGAKGLVRARGEPERWRRAVRPGAPALADRLLAA